MEIEELLKELGFKEYEIKAYKAILFLVSATPREIAKEAKIPQTRVYDVLEGLRKRGIINVSPGKPIHYNLVPLEIGLLPFIRSNQKKWKEIEEEIKELSNSISKKEKYSTKIALFQGWNVIKRIIVDDIKNSEKEILRFMRFGKIDEEIFSEMEKAINRGVEVKIIGVYKKEREHVIEKYKRIGCKIAFVNLDTLTLVRENIFDSNIVHIDFSEPGENKYITPKGTLLVRVNDPSTAQFFKDRFDLLFQNSKKY